MAKTGQDIVEKENLPKNLDRLAAQREMYFQAKRLFLLQFILIAVVPVVLAGIAVALLLLSATTDLNWLRAGYAVIVAGTDVFLINHVISQLKQKAACVQELFDCEVLSLRWNNVCSGEQPKPEDIKRYADRYRSRVKSQDNLRDWYAKTIAEVDGPAAKVICQRSNFAYDGAIRRSFLYWIISLSLIILVTIFSVALAVNVSARAIATMSLLPVLPLLVFLWKLIKELNASIKNLDSLNATITRLWSEILNDTATNVESTIRQVQDRIYTNRKTSPLIPEWFYNWKRSRLEEQMYYGVEELVQEYRAVVK
jgi:hypothetical protein